MQHAGISGTPGFIVGTELVLGALDVNGLKELVARAGIGKCVSHLFIKWTGWTYNAVYNIYRSIRFDVSHNGNRIWRDSHGVG